MHLVAFLQGYYGYFVPYVIANAIFLFVFTLFEQCCNLKWEFCCCNLLSYLPEFDWQSLYWVMHKGAWCCKMFFLFVNKGVFQVLTMIRCPVLFQIPLPRESNATFRYDLGYNPWIQRQRKENMWLDLMLIFAQTFRGRANFIVILRLL